MINTAPLCNTPCAFASAKVDAAMNMLGTATAHCHCQHPGQASGQHVVLLAGLLHLVSGPELQSLRQALARGGLPPDFEAKLRRLSEGDLLHRFLARNCRLFVALLAAAQDGCFRELSHADCERLLRVLAYVRKDDDAIPDYRLDGFMDDQQELRAALTELHRGIESFKIWRLRHQVPAMWLHN